MYIYTCIYFIHKHIYTFSLRIWLRNRLRLRTRLQSSQMTPAARKRLPLKDSCGAVYDCATVLRILAASRSITPGFITLTWVSSSGYPPHI